MVDPRIWAASDSADAGRLDKTNDPGIGWLPGISLHTSANETLWCNRGPKDGG